MSTTVGQVSVESLATAVTRVVAEVESCDSLELPPLYDSIDMDALQTFCAHDSFTDDDTDGGVVSFVYSDSVVQVDTGDPVTVTAAEATDESIEEAFVDPTADTESLSLSEF